MTGSNGCSKDASKLLSVHSVGLMAETYHYQNAPRSAKTIPSVVSWTNIVDAKFSFKGKVQRKAGAQAVGMKTTGLSFRPYTLLNFNKKGE